MIDWRAHFEGIVHEIETAQRFAQCVEMSSIPDNVRTSTAASWIVGLARRLGSRHIPGDVRRAAPGIPWGQIARLAEHVERRQQHPESLSPYLIEDFNLHVAPRLVPALRQIEERLVMTMADGNDRTGVLSVSERGGHVHATVRIPATKLDQLYAFVTNAYDGRPAATIKEVRERLAAASPMLWHHQVRWIAVYGSVARACAGAGSDVDIAYRSQQRHGFFEWAALLSALEKVLERVVDAHELAPDAAPPEGSVVVWEAHEGGHMVNERDAEDPQVTAEKLVGRHPEIVKVEGVQGGLPTFRDSRLCVHVVIALLRAGETDENLLRGYPRLRTDLLDWLRANI